MSAGAAKEYRFKQKDDWRGWHWNRIAQRLARSRIQTHRAVVLGLFGAEALDIPPAVRRGFRLENLIGVETDRHALQSMRAQGVNSIQGKLGDVLDVWGNEPRIDAIVADYCGGVNSERLFELGALDQSFALRSSTVIVVNMLRGRDDTALLGRVTGWRRHLAGLDPWPMVDEKHRAQVLPYMLLQSAMKGAAAGAATAIAHGASPQHLGELAQRMFYLVARSMRPEFNSYRSGTQVFDSVVMSLPFSADVTREELEAHDISTATWESATFSGSLVRRRVAAAKAVRTRRLQGETP